MFDALTRAAAELLEAPMALLSLVDDERVFFKSIYGLREPWATKREAPLTHTLCEHVVKAGEVVAVSDFARDIDPRYHPGLLALGGVAYAGAPVRTAEGIVLGSLCVIDVRTRSFAADQIRTLTALADVAMAQIAARRPPSPGVAAAPATTTADPSGAAPDAQLHKMIVEQACDAVLVSDSAGRLLATNPAACELLGYPRDALLARKMTDLEPDVASPPPPLRFEVLKAGKKMLRAERRMQRADGSVIIVEVSARVVEDGRMLVIAREIGERKLTEEALRKSEVRLRSAMAAARVSDWEWDIRAGTVSMSPLARSLHGITDGPFDLYQAAIHPDDRAHVFRSLKKAVEDGGAYRVEYRVVLSEGGERSIVMRAGAITDEAGNTVRLVGLCGEKTDG